jgi:hypothetical protein
MRRRSDNEPMRPSAFLEDDAAEASDWGWSDWDGIDWSDLRDLTGTA